MSNSASTEEVESADRSIQEIEYTPNIQSIFASGPPTSCTPLLSRNQDDFFQPQPLIPVTNQNTTTIASTSQANSSVQIQANKQVSSSARPIQQNSIRQKSVENIINELLNDPRGHETNRPDNQTQSNASSNDQSIEPNYPQPINDANQWQSNSAPIANAVSPSNPNCCNPMQYPSLQHVYTSTQSNSPHMVFPVNTAATAQNNSNQITQQIVSQFQAAQNCFLAQPTYHITPLPSNTNMTSQTRFTNNNRYANARPNILARIQTNQTDITYTNNVNMNQNVTDQVNNVLNSPIYPTSGYPNLPINNQQLNAIIPAHQANYSTTNQVAHNPNLANMLGSSRRNYSNLPSAGGLLDNNSTQTNQQTHFNPQYCQQVPRARAQKRQRYSSEVQEPFRQQSYPNHQNVINQQQMQPTQVYTPRPRLRQPNYVCYRPSLQTQYELPRYQQQNVIRAHATDNIQPVSTIYHTVVPQSVSPTAIPIASPRQPIYTQNQPNAQLTSGQPPVSVSSTTTQNAAQQRTQSIETQTEIEYLNKACQVDTRTGNMVNKSLNATATMVDASSQTETNDAPVEQKIMVDRCSSPINFGPKKKITPKRNAQVLIDNPEMSRLERSNEEDEINVIE